MKDVSIKIAKALKYYVNNTSNRCVNKGQTQCFYSGKEQGIKARCCLVGYFLKADVRKLADKTSVDVKGLEILHEKKEIKLPNIIINNIELMQELQGFHDNQNNWNIGKGKGLSRLGKERLSRIITKHELDISDFEYCLNA